MSAGAAEKDGALKGSRELGRAESGTLARFWSRRRSRAFSGPVRLREGRSERLYADLFDGTLAASTRKLKKPWCLSAFEDGAGIVELDKRWSLAVSLESRERRCAVDPYGGAVDGLGGAVLGVLTAGLGAKPVLGSDVLCLCPPDNAEPSSAPHPRRALSSMVAGVRDYGNRLGLPVASGALCFDEGYRHEPSAFLGCVGLLPAGSLRKKAVSGDLVVLVGGRASRGEARGNGSAADAQALQCGDAISAKRLIDALMKARDARLYRSIAACGAGGLAAAAAELALQSGGARVDAAKAPSASGDMEPWEIWLARWPERALLAVPPKNLKALTAIMEAEGVELSALGELSRSGRLEALHQGRAFVDLDLGALRGGPFKRERAAVWDPPRPEPTKARCESARCGETLHWMLSSLNVCSREWAIRQYDHEVQGGTVLKPLHGLQHDGPGDACVIWPIAATDSPESFKGFAAAHGINPELGKTDPYQMALACVDEALGNLACVGADVSRACLAAGFRWGDTDDPRVLGSLARAAEGCRDAALGFETPFVSCAQGGDEGAPKGAGGGVPGTLLVSATAPVPDIRKAVTMDLKAPGDPVYLVGRTGAELGASLLERRLGARNGPSPKVDARSAREAYRKLSQASAKGLVLAAHNLSEGGLAVAAAEMAFSGEVGVKLELDAVPCAKDARSEAVLLFAETPSRVLVEVAPAKEGAFLKAMRGAALCRVGTTLANPVLRVIGLDSRVVLEEGLHALKQSWQKTLPEAACARHGNGR